MWGPPKIRASTNFQAVAASFPARLARIVVPNPRDVASRESTLRDDRRLHPTATRGRGSDTHGTRTYLHRQPQPYLHRRGISQCLRVPVQKPIASQFNSSVAPRREATSCPLAIRRSRLVAHGPSLAIRGSARGSGDPSLTARCWRSVAQRAAVAASAPFAPVPSPPLGTCFCGRKRITFAANPLRSPFHTAHRADTVMRFRVLILFGTLLAVAFNSPNPSDFPGLAPSLDGRSLPMALGGCRLLENPT